ncbi:MAG: GNAT family N-acetyltransferase [Myxococcota bacterium]
MSEQRLAVKGFEPADAASWDAFVADALNGTFLHTRRFLGYHEQRFQDCSLLVVDESGRLVGVLPAAVGRESGFVDSHPGLSYGGLVHTGELVGERALEAFERIQRHYRERGYTRLRYRAIPRPYYQVPLDDDSYALFRLNAQRTRVDLSAGFALEARREASELRARELKKAAKQGVSSEPRSTAWPEFWQVLEGVLAERHSARPVHSLQEITRLVALFPDEIELIVARRENTLVAGTVVFYAGNVAHTQYLATSASGRDVGALTQVVETAISRAATRHCTWFSLGTSNEDAGRVLNAGLYRWKLSFGASGVVHETFELPL